jgi:hypothetical protein
MLLLSLNALTRLKALRLLLAFAGLLLPGLSYAAEWSLKGSVDQSLGYDDNVRMQITPQGSFKYMIVPVLTFLHKTDVSEIHANATYGTQVYTDIPQFDQDIQHYGLGGLYKTERFDWGLNSSFSSTPSRNTAVQDSGVFNNNSNRNTWSVSPSVSYKIDEINSLILSPTYTETTYSGSGSSNITSGNNAFRNNKTTNINLAWQRLWTERYSSTASLFYSNSNFQGGNNGGSGASSSFDSVGINLSNAYSWSENWKLDGTVGVRHTESKNRGVSSSSVGFLANIAVNYTGESFSSGIHFSRSLIPSSLGQLQEQTGVGLHFNYSIAERLSASFTTSYQQSTLVNAVNQGTRENITLQPSINWQMAPEWTISGSYRYRTQNSTRAINNDPVDITVDSNLFLLSINYNWQGLTLSR